MNSRRNPRGAGRLIARFILAPAAGRAGRGGDLPRLQPDDLRAAQPARLPPGGAGRAANRRWQAAFELSAFARHPAAAERVSLTAETLRIFEGLTPKRPDDLLVRRYLVLVLGRLGEREAVPALINAAQDPDPDTRLYAIWALGKSAIRPASTRCSRRPSPRDAGVRKMAAYVLGQLGDARAVPRLKVLAEDRVADVRWNAAIALAELKDPSGLPVLALDDSTGTPSRGRRSSRAIRPRRPWSTR